MSEDEQRIAIAEACGWKNCGRYTGTTDIRGQRASAPMGCLSKLPDYLYDLNAMREAENVLCHNWSEQRNYYVELFKICGHEDCIAVRATAAQRAEAFLKTLYLWKR